MAELKIRFVGSGGMGVILVGIILGKAAIYENKHATQTQSYGAQQRGGKVFSDVIISDKPILYPVIDKADILVAFSQEAFDVYSSAIKADGLILINSDLVKVENNSTNLIKISASSLARDLGNEKVLNIIMLSSLIKKTEILSKDNIIKAINDSIPKKYSAVNIKAFNSAFNS